MNTKVIGILFFSLLMSCSTNDKPKECKDAIIDTIRSEPQEVQPQDRKVMTEEKKPVKEEQLPKVILIITSQACKCTLERCSQGEKTVNEIIQQFPSKLTFEKLDYAREQDPVTQLAKEYQLQFLPALLFFDNEGAFKGKMEGFLNNDEIKAKLKEIGI
jgi:thioredoxin-related protein